MDYLEDALLHTVSNMMGCGKAYTPQFYVEFSKLDTLVKIGVLLKIYEITEEISVRDRYVILLAILLSPMNMPPCLENKILVEKKIDGILEAAISFMEKIRIQHMKTPGKSS